MMWRSCGAAHSPAQRCTALMIALFSRPAHDEHDGIAHPPKRHPSRKDPSADTVARANRRSGDVEQRVVIGRTGTPARGGGREGRGGGTSVGRPRCARIRRATVRSSMTATSRNRPPQRRHSSTSKLPAYARSAPARSRRSSACHRDRAKAESFAASTAPTGSSMPAALRLRRKQRAEDSQGCASSALRLFAVLRLTSMAHPGR